MLSLVALPGRTASRGAFPGLQVKHLERRPVLVCAGSPAAGGGGGGVVRPREWRDVGSSTILQQTPRPQHRVGASCVPRLLPVRLARCPG